MTSLGQESPPNCPANSTFEESITDIRNSTLAPAYKRRKIRQQSIVVMQEIIDVCNRHNETLANVVGECCSTDKKCAPSVAREAITEAIDIMVEQKGVKSAVTPSQLTRTERGDDATG